MLDLNARAAFIAQALREKIGNKVYGGPFKGMQLPQFGGNFAPYLLGVYEHELHPIIERIIERRYSSIFNVGCSWGYYAVGLAWCMPQAYVGILDINEEMMHTCYDVGDMNGCNNLHVAKEFTPYYGLIIMDCEGAEEEYLDPAKYNFKSTDILVELHECIKPGLTQAVIDRFKDTHNVELIYNNPTYFDLQQIFGQETRLQHFDNALATWEGRAGETPWAYMTCKNIQSL